MRRLTVLTWCCAHLVWLGSCDGRPRGVGTQRPLSQLGERDAIVVIDLSHQVPESSRGGGFFPLPPDKTYAGLVRALEKAKAEPAPGYLVRLGANSFSWAQTEELGRLLGELRGKEHPVVCHAHGYGNSSIWLARSGCDEVWLSPAGTVDTVGIAGQSVYLKGLLERFHVKADFLHVGRYKSAAESLTEDGPSEPAKQSMRAVLGSLREAWREGVSAHTEDPLAVDSLETGPWVPEAAVAVGLVDQIGYESAARDHLKEFTGHDKFESAFGALSSSDAALGISEILRALTGADDVSGQPHVAILPAVGGISMESGGGLSEDGITASEWTKQIRALKKDDAVKAVVLRIDSPGGSALASDLLWHELMELRKEKPLVASVGNMAASGGYYLACAADAIFAEQTSIVGSIGVVGGKIVVDEALEQFGVSSYTFTAKDSPDDGARAAYLSVLTEWDDATRQRVQEQMDAIYDLFVARVAEGRQMEREQVLASAEGRIWSGAQGHDRGLVDEFGGLSAAVLDAKARADLPPDAPVTLEGPEGSLMQLLGLGDEPSEQDVRQALLQAQASRPAWWRALTDSQRAQLQSLLPLVVGERVLAVPPMFVDVR